MYMKSRILNPIRWFGVCAVVFTSTAGHAITDSEGWKMVGGILEQIQPPTFADRDFLITKYGARGDANRDCTEAFEKAIAACNKAGGGRVVVPKGTFLTGAIHLKSNVNLYLKKGALVSFFTNTDDYLPMVHTRFEGIECMNFSPLIYAFEQENIAITGQGTFDGNADITNWWRWKWTQKPDVAISNQQGDGGVPVKERLFGDGHLLRPVMVQPYRCKNILIEGVTFKNSPMWHINPVRCENITVRKVTIIGHGRMALT